MSAISHFERVVIADHVYGEGPIRTVSNPPGYTLLKSKEYKSGLEIYAFRKDGTNEVVFAVRGSDDSLDFALTGPNYSHALGRLCEQDKDALKFVDEFLRTATERGEEYIYSFAGDSKGGAIVQILAWTFGYCGTTTEAAAGGGVVKDPAYLDFVRDELVTRDTPAGIAPGKVLNIFEKGSPVSWLSAIAFGVNHIGVSMTFDFVSADLSRTVSHAIISQHTDRAARINALSQVEHPDGIDEVLVHHNNELFRLAEEIQELREMISSGTEGRIPHYGSREPSEPDEFLTSRLARLEIKLQAMIEVRDQLIVDNYGHEGAMDNWLRAALENARSDGAADPENSTKSAVNSALLAHPQQFHIPGDPNVYWLMANGKIVQTVPYVLIRDEEHTDTVLNEGTLPLSSGDLLKQLQDMGVSESQALTLVAQSGLAPDEYVLQQANALLNAFYEQRAAQAEQLRSADLAVMGAQNGLAQAVQSGDVVAVVNAALDYYQALQGRALFLPDDTFKGLGASEQSMLAGFGTALALGQALRGEDGHAIALQGIDLLRSIDRYLAAGETEGGFIGEQQSALLSLGSLGIGLARAIEQGDALAITQSSLSFASGLQGYYNAFLAGESAALDTALGFCAGAMGSYLQAATAVLGLVINLAKLDDVLDSGDGGAIAEAAATTAHYAISSYNNLSTLYTKSAEGSSAMGNLSWVGYAAAAYQASQGNGKDAATTAASTYLLAYCGPVGWALAAVIQIGNAMVDLTDPPEASAWFGINGDGSLFMEVSGDRDLQEAASAYGQPLLSVYQYYQEVGGRLLAEDGLPRLSITAGEPARLIYGNGSGTIVIALDDPGEAAQRLYGALVARDHGERLDRAIQTATCTGGAIDWQAVDRAMAAYGYSRNGITYTTGETSSRHGFSTGSGVFRGGGNVGPQGQLFTARPRDVKSLPIPPDQLPSQRLGEIIRVAGLNNMFGDSGAGLLAMALVLPGGLLDADSAAAATSVQSAPGDGLVKPLDAVALADYLAAQESLGEEGIHPRVPASGMIRPLPVESDALQALLARSWPEHPYLQRWSTDRQPDSAYYFHEQPSAYATLHNSASLWASSLAAGLYHDGSLAAWWYREQERSLLARHLQQDDMQRHAETFAAPQAQSFSGHRAEAPAPVGDPGPDSDADAPAPPGSAQEPLFVMAEDSILRFLPVQLLNATQAGSFQIAAELPVLLGFGQARHGHVWQDDQGDVRFQPTPGFSGTTSFSFTVQLPDGTIETRQATVVVSPVNHPPVLVDDRIVLQEGEAFYLDRLLHNDHDPDGDPLVLDHLRGVTNGEVLLLGGRLVFVPDPGFHGDVAFSYWVRDHADAYPAMAFACLSYVDVNDGVQTGDDRFLMLEDTVLTTSIDELLANDVEHDGEQISFLGVADAGRGSVVLQPDGTILFTPNPDYAGSDAGFSYQVSDQSGNRSTGWVAIEVLPTREPPVVSSTTRAPINEDEVLVFTPETVASFVHDPDGDPLHLDRIDVITGGSVTMVDGHYAFVPDPDYYGPAAITYRAGDNHRGTVEGRLDFSILPVNDPIDTGDDRLATREDQPVQTTVADLLANDTDVDGDVFTFISVGEAAHGAVLHHDDGSIVFTPEEDYAGPSAGFHYLVADSEGLISTGWVAVAIEPVNDRPQIIAHALDLLEDEPLVFAAQTVARFAADIDDDPLTVIDCTIVSGGGTISVENGRYTYTPAADYFGPAALQVAVTDGVSEPVTTVLELSIHPVDDPTHFGADRLLTREEQSVSVTAAELLANDHDADGPLSFIGLGEARHGSVAYNGQGGIVFTPEHDYFGDAAGFFYRVADAQGYEAAGFVTVQVENVNDAPRIIADQLVINEDEPLTFTAETIGAFLHDPDGDPLTLASLTADGAGHIESDGALFTFVPDPNYHGPGLVVYRAADGNGGEVAGELHLVIVPVDDPTDFGDDRFTMLEDTVLSTSVAELLANDTDADGPLQFVALGEARFGAVSLDGQGAIRFSPDPDYFGDQAGFSYLVRDPDGNEAEGWVTVVVENVNDEPIIIADHVFLDEDQPLILTEDVLARFVIDPDGQPLRLTGIDSVAGGRIALAGDTYTFIPDEHFYGEAAFTYQAANDDGETISGTLAITILPVNDLPIIAPVRLTGSEDHPVSVALAELLAGATDVEDGTDLRFGGFIDATNGDVYLDSDGVVHFLPDDDFFGSASFTYRVLDSEGGVGTGEVSIAVAGVNDAPVAVDDEGIVAWSNNRYENVYLASVFLANDYDVDFDPLTIIDVGPARFGTVSLDGAGNIHYLAPETEWVGIDSFVYRISDGHGQTAEATARLDVKINTPPDVYPELICIEEDVIVTLGAAELLANDSDIDGDPLTIIGAAAGDHCEVSWNLDGTVTFRPELNYNDRYPGQAWFTYTVSDGISDPVDGVAYFAIEPVNDKPILTPERISGAVEDNDFQFRPADLLANDTDVEMASPYEEDAIFFSGVWGAANGTIHYDDSSGMIRYRPNPDFFGIETFSYRVVDSFGAQSTVRSEIHVEGVNDLPVVQEDIGSPAEEYIWNYYSIAGLLANDYDVDGDRLTIKSPRVIDGSAEVTISGGNLAVKPAIGTNRVVISYIVSDGNGGEVPSKLIIPQILEHNFAPQFTNQYRVDSYVNMTWAAWTEFNFQVKDQNGGDNWQGSGGMGNIASISAGRLNTNYPSATLQETNAYGGFRFSYYPPGMTDPVGYVATFTITARDHAGATGTIFVDYNKLATRKGTYTYQYNPIVLDLDGDGIELLPIGDNALFDWNFSGRPDVSGWVGADDAFLVYDYDGDGLITKADELSFVSYALDAVTDLQGLRAFDTNHNGRLDPGDEQWSSFGLWQDANTNGSTDDGEFTSLDDFGIVAIDLTGEETFVELEGNYVYATTTCELADGTIIEAADVGLSGGAVAFEEEIADEPGATPPEPNSEDQPDTDHADPSAEAQTTEQPTEPINDQDPIDPIEPNDEPAPEDAPLDLTDAELNRLNDQMNADIAACTDEETDIDTSLTYAEEASIPDLDSPLEAGDTPHL